MKGLTHYCLAVAVASCFPPVVRDALAGDGRWLVFSGLLGLLPDTLDFRLARFWTRIDVDIAPDPLNPDAALIVAGLAEAVRRAGDSGRTLRLRLRTVSLGADRWRQYRVRFDPPRGGVSVTWGPVVNTGQRPVEESEGASAPVEPAVARLDYPIQLDYRAELEVDIWDGPVLALIPDRAHRVRIEFLPWHRGASHSLLTALGVGGVLAGVTGSPGMGAVLGLAYASHVAADQWGFLGSRLFWPVSRRRYAGLQRVHAMDRFANFSLIWLSAVVIFANLAGVLEGGGGWGARIRMVGWGAMAPLAAAAGLIEGWRRWQRRTTGNCGKLGGWKDGSLGSARKHAVSRNPRGENAPSFRV